MKLISGSMLYDAVHCPHRVSMDAFEDPQLRDEPNAFVELLWAHGLQHEKQIADSLGSRIVSLLDLDPEEKEARTREAIASRTPLIYSGRLTYGDLVGEPDLLQLRGNGYIAGDIKSGAGYDGDEADAKLKKHYAVQVAHYTHLLELNGISDGTREAFIVDRRANTVLYPLSSALNKKTALTWWQFYEETLQLIRDFLVGTTQSRAALCALCGQCHWSTRCDETLRETDDLSLITELGRAKRDVMMTEIDTVQALANIDVEKYISNGKTIFKGIGPDTLRKFQERATLLSTPNAKPYKKIPINLPAVEQEIFFDIEADPIRDVCYLHGFIERCTHNSSEHYSAYFADAPTADAEKAAFRAAWLYLSGQTGLAVVYYYSKYERTAWKHLAEKYPDVCAVADIEALFAQPWMVDLLAIVSSSTEWPTNSRSIKALAKYLGFKWRDTNPSGAASIEWYNRFIETGDDGIKQRILDYNEDDCAATRVLLDGLRKL